jgi:hypothetical protein
LNSSFNTELKYLLRSSNCWKLHYDEVSHLTNEEADLNYTIEILRVGVRFLTLKLVRLNPVRVLYTWRVDDTCRPFSLVFKQVLHYERCVTSESPNLLYNTAC